MRTLVNFLKHSNIQIQIDVNPVKWQFVPQFNVSPHEVWLDDRYKQVMLSFLFVTVYLMIDDGSW